MRVRLNATVDVAAGLLDTHFRPFGAETALKIFKRSFAGFLLLTTFAVLISKRFK